MEKNSLWKKKCLWSWLTVCFVWSVWSHCKLFNTYALKINGIGFKWKWIGTLTTAFFLTLSWKRNRWNERKEMKIKEKNQIKLWWSSPFIECILFSSLLTNAERRTQNAHRFNIWRWFLLSWFLLFRSVFSLLLLFTWDLELGYGTKHDRTTVVNFELA